MHPEPYVQGAGVFYIIDLSMGTGMQKGTVISVASWSGLRLLQGFLDEEWSTLTSGYQETCL